MRIVKIRSEQGETVVGGSLPDIDSEFDSAGKGWVKEYMSERFGKNQVCPVGTYQTMALKGAIKAVFRTYHNTSADIKEVNLVTSCLDDKEDKTITDLFIRSTTEKKVFNFIQKYPYVIYDLPYFLKAPVSTGTHACAVMIFPKDRDMYHWTPIYRNKDGIILTVFEGGELDSTGFLKQDILAIKLLDKFKGVRDRLRARGIDHKDTYDLPLDDEKVYDYLAKGWNGGVFQLGSDGLRGYSRQLKPSNIDDIIACIALYRPGTMQNKFHEAYIRRKNGEEEVKYMWGTENVLNETYALPCYQEQVANICVEVAGFDLVMADSARKAMGKKDITKLLPYKDSFIDGAVAKGCPQGEAESMWSMLLEFASYAFNKCVSGDTKFYRASIPNGKDNPTIADMYKIKNDLAYAKSVKKLPLRSKYNREGYGKAMSLGDDGLLRYNNIVDIRYEGVKSVYLVELDNGASIKVTENHKFPTNNGIKRCDELSVGNDSIYFNTGYKQDRWKPGNVYSGDNKHNSEKGKCGFQKKSIEDSNFLQFKYYKENLKLDYCELCGDKESRLEVHHIDGNHHTNNKPENLQTVCISCHKKAHYKMGRTKAGQKGLQTELVLIKSITYAGKEEVYDVEMDAPNHTFTTDSGIVTCNSHSAEYGVMAYRCQYEKVHYPVEFWASQITLAKDEDIPKYLSEIKKAGAIKINPPEINRSGVEIGEDEDGNIYWSLTSIKGIAGIDKEKPEGGAAVVQIKRDKIANGKYTSFDNFLERNKFKGSKVTKTTIEGLILSGAFDKIENITNVLQRHKLVEKYRTTHKVKINDKTDFIVKNIDIIGEEWLWQLKQKQLSGLAFFDYESLVLEHLGKRSKVLSEDFMSFDILNPTDGCVGGYVIESKECTSVKGKFARVTLEMNYNIFSVVIWSDTYEQLEFNADDMKGNLLLLSGKASFHEKYGNQFTTNDKSDVKMLKLN